MYSNYFSFLQLPTLNMNGFFYKLNSTIVMKNSLWGGVFFFLLEKIKFLGLNPKIRNEKGSEI